MSAESQDRRALGAIFGRLFENEFATLDGIALSCRTHDGIEYVEGLAALRLWLDDRVTTTPAEPSDSAIVALHEACHAAAPGHDTVISGWSRHLRILLRAGFPPPPATSMLRNRGVDGLAAHLVEPMALQGAAVRETVARAQEVAVTGGMRHHLLISTDGYVVVSGAPPAETMAHWHNVELAARVECLRIEDAALLGED